MGSQESNPDPLTLSKDLFHQATLPYRFSVPLCSCSSLPSSLAHTGTQPFSLSLGIRENSTQVPMTQWHLQPEVRVHSGKELSSDSARAVGPESHPSNAQIWPGLLRALQS